jgi:hypothetical protein
MDSTTPPSDSGPEMEATTTTDAPTGPGEDAEAGAGPTPDGGTGLVDEAGVSGFPQQVAAALCGRFADCCVPNLDGGVFDVNACIAANLGLGYQGSSVGATLGDGGHVVFDGLKAQSCLNQINAIDCSANLRSGLQEQQILSACFGALTGTLAAGAPCTDPIECSPGQFCDPVDGGGGSVCAPLRTTGQSCGDFGPNGFGSADTACSYRASGNTGLYCKFGTFPVPFADAGSWLCEPAQGTGANCFNELECQSDLCNPDENYVCVTAETLVTPSVCSAYIKPAPVVDAGSDSGADSGG